MNIYSIIKEIEAYAPRSFQEKWDNSGLQIGLPDGQTECTGVLLCLDVSEDIVDEAVRRGCNLVVSHHPLIFKGFKSLTGTGGYKGNPQRCRRIFGAHQSRQHTWRRVVCHGIASWRRGYRCDRTS